jgi:hypothetical protein
VNTPVILAESDFYDIREIIHTVTYWPWALLLAAILSAAIAAYWWRKQHSKHTIAIAPGEMPHVKAKRLLDELGQIAEQMDAEPFTIKVSAILRYYLEEAFAIPAPEQTSEEFLQNLSTQSWITAALQNELEGFMQVADLVKFARQSLASHQRQRLLESAKQVVIATEPQPQPLSP